MSSSTPHKNATRKKTVEEEDYHQRSLAWTIIAEPLLQKVHQKPTPRGKLPVIIEINLDYSAGREEARNQIKQWLSREKARTYGIDPASHPYIFAELTAAQVRNLAKWVLENAEFRHRPIYRIWDDAEVHALLTESVRTIKADAAQITFRADGKDIVWAVLDSGIDGNHPHFHSLDTLKLPNPLRHYDFVQPDQTEPIDPYGHGTHVAGIIAGCLDPDKEYTETKSFENGGKETTFTRYNLLKIQPRQENGIQYSVNPIREKICGVSPHTKVMSMRVLDEKGSGQSSRIISAIEEILKINDYGRRILIHGVNLSLGYWFNPEWHACGQSPLCVAVDRLVRSGVVVVVAAGNSGYIQTQVYKDMSAVTAAGQTITINDPGNADLAITVGSTHRNMPHLYGVSFFSSKGPTGDGRLKPDLVAPGEKIVSCATGKLLEKTGVAESGEVKDPAFYLEYSGTSMAAPHVSGAIASFLSIRREFIGRPEQVKQIFLKAATDLNRTKTFQGAGLLDLMRAIQSI